MKFLNSVLAVFSLFAGLQLASAATPTPIKSIRLDPGFLYDLSEASTLSPSQFSSSIVNDIKSAGFNTIYLYVMSSYYGTFYQTTYPQIQVEGDFGKSNLARLISDQAKAAGLSVVAVVPVNDFRLAWTNNPAWRIKKKSLADYKPDASISFLSVSHPAFRAWYVGLLKDMMAKLPSIDAVEAVEPGYDLNWAGTTDYNSAATDEFKRQYPGQDASGSVWKKFRTQELTKHLALFGQTVKAAGKEFHLVQTYTVNSSGAMLSSASIADGFGFDWSGVLNLPITQRPDVITGEFMYQQWKAEYGTSVFTPAWTSAIGKAFNSFVAGRARPIMHVEYSEFSGTYGTFSANLTDIQSALSGALTYSSGYDIYDYYQWRQLRGKY